jgi:hypothetical protein
VSFEHFLDRWSSVPAEMKAEPRWLMWRLETRPRKGGKPMPTKVPLQTSGAYAKSTDPSTWTTFENACGHIHTFDGIGFVLGGGWIGIDFDGKGDPLEVVLERVYGPHTVAEWVKRVGGYAEVSPSGSGLHIVGKGVLSGGSGNRRGAVEVYGDARYFTVSGDSISNGSIELKHLDEVVAAVLPEQVRAESRPASRPLDLDDDELVRKALAARNGDKFGRLWGGAWEGEHESASEADLALAGALAFWTGGDEARIENLMWSSGLAREKWTRNRTYLGRTIALAIETTDEHYDPKRPQRASAPTGRYTAEKPAGDRGRKPKEPRQIEDGVSLGGRVVRDTDLVSVRRRPVKTLFDEGLIRVGALNMVFGPPGIGKGMLAVVLAAEMAMREKTTVFVSFEDDVEYDLKPRLQAHNLSDDELRRIQMFRVVSEHDGAALIPKLSTDLALLEAFIERHQAELVVIDPFVNFLDPGVDVNGDFMGVSDMAQKIHNLAQRTNVAVLGNAHVNKSAAKEWHMRMLGSVGFQTVPRSIIAFALDPELPTGPDRLAVQVKSSGGALARSRVYRMSEILLEATDNEPEQTIGKLAFQEFSDIDRFSLYGENIADLQMFLAAAFLGRLLSREGPVESSRAKALAAAEDISERTLQRALHESDVFEWVRAGFPSRTYWKFDFQEVNSPLPGSHGATGEEQGANPDEQTDSQSRQVDGATVEPSAHAGLGAAEAQSRHAHVKAARQPEQAVFCEFHRKATTVKTIATGFVYLACGCRELEEGTG